MRCPACKGVGEIKRDPQWGDGSYTCPACNGTGKVSWHFYITSSLKWAWYNTIGDYANGPRFPGN